MTTFEMSKPTENEVELAQAARKMMVKYLDHSAARSFVIVPDKSETGDCPPQLVLPPTAIKLLAEVLKYMADRESITLIHSSKEFSTQEAANFLNVSRPFVIKLVDEGKLKASLVGRHRRIAFSDLEAYRNQVMNDAKNAIDEFSATFGGDD
jgi:excisionase family DNA binding protein